MNKRPVPPEGVVAGPARDERGEQERTGDGADVASAGEPDVRVIDRRWWARDSADSETPARSDKPTYVEELERRIAEKDAVLAEYAARYRAAADEFEEARDRLRKEVAKDVEREKRRILTSFLEIIDNLERAIEASRDASDETRGVISLRKGVEMVRQQFLSTLNGYGVAPINVSGARFDPNLHDAISVVPVTDAEREDTVIDVVRPGYQVDDDVLRPASVTVGKRAPMPQ